MHKHAADLDSLVGPSHPALDARVGATASAATRHDGREVTGAKANQRIVRVERGDNQFADFAFGHRVARAGANDFYNHTFVKHQAFPRFGFIGNQAKIGRGIALVAGNAVLCQPVTQAGRKCFARNQRPGNAGQRQLHFECLVDDDFQEAGSADVARRFELGHGKHLLLSLAGAGRKHRTSERVSATFHHGPGRHKVVAETVVDQLAGPKAGRIHCPRQAPVVFARRFWFVNRARAGEHAWHFVAVVQYAEAAERITASVGRAGGQLAFQQLVLACDR